MLLFFVNKTKKQYKISVDIINFLLSFEGTQNFAPPVG